jgi:hypothetical protein
MMLRTSDKRRAAGNGMTVISDGRPFGVAVKSLLDTKG